MTDEKLKQYVKPVIYNYGNIEAITKGGENSGIDKLGLYGDSA